VSIRIPLVEPPSWFLKCIRTQGVSQIIILDDDVNIHQIWERKFCRSKDKVGLVHFSAPIQFEVWIQNQSSLSKNLYLVDYEFNGSDTNGLKLIQQFRLSKEAILVTSRYEQIEVRVQCEALGLKLLPKGLAGFVPID